MRAMRNRRSGQVVGRKALGLLACSALTVGVLSACGGEQEFDDLIDLRDAAVDAGLDCDDWKRRDVQSGSCGSDSVLFVYESESVRKKEVQDNLDNLVLAGFEYDYVVGKNWAISAPDAGAAEYLHAELGGEIYHRDGE
jgi:hypothetical protein